MALITSDFVSFSEIVWIGPESKRVYIGSPSIASDPARLAPVGETVILLHPPSPFKECTLQFAGQN